MPADYPDFPDHDRVRAYLDHYADTFGLRDSIRFRTMVERVTPQTDGTFLVTVRSRAGARETLRARAVLVASGHHWSPRRPDLPGTFAGDVLHAHDYRAPEPYGGRRVLVVGMGNTGCDIACDLARVASRTILSSRRGAHVIPKYLCGVPLDTLCPDAVWRFAPRWLFRPAFAAVVRLNRGSLAGHGLPQPAHRVLEEHPTISSDLPTLVREGRVAMKPDVERLDGDGVRFVDGSREPVDAVILATGYRIEFPFLDQAVIDPADNEVRLYRNVVHPDVPGLLFIGLVQPWGAIFPLAEAQAAWVGDLVAGRCRLPGRAAMLRAIEADRRAQRRRYVTSPRHTIQVDFHAYRALLARERRRGRVRPAAV